MSDTVYLLHKNGSVEELRSGAFEGMQKIGSDMPATELSEFGRDFNGSELVIEFSAPSDGRGYSLAKSLRGVLGYRRALYASGYLNPDQLQLALQTGFDGVWVTSERWNSYGSVAWRSALNPVVGLSYSLSDSLAVRSIWQLRHG